MKVVILCGGLGTRLREETEFRPKPMVEVGGRPILWHIMKSYAYHGFKDFVLCLGYRGSTIKEYFLNYEAMNNDFSICLGSSQIRYHEHHTEQGFGVTLAETGLESMTGGRIRKIAKYIHDDTFLLTYGDGLSDVDIRALVDFHKSHGRIATVTTVRPISRFGMIELGRDEGTISQFTEKPKSDGWMSAGFFVLNREVFDYLGADDCIFEREPLARLASEGQLMAFRHEGFFYAMDTYREYLHLNELWSKGTAPWKVWSNEEVAQCVF